MGAGGIPSGGVYAIYESRPVRMDAYGKPNSKLIMYVNGQKYRARWYDWQGRAIRNRDYIHQDAHHNHSFPHDHDWYWDGNKGIRDKNYVEPDYFAFPEENDE